MQPSTLRVRARGPRTEGGAPPLVQNYERLEAGTNAFIGHRFGELADKPGQFGFIATGEVEEVPYRPEYVKALLDGDLLAADAATAKAAGLSDETLTAQARPAVPPPPPTRDELHAPSPSPKHNGDR